MYKSLLSYFMLIVLALLIIGTELAISQDISHMEHQIIWGEGPSHLWKMNERIENQAQMLPKEVSESGAIKRLAFFDIAFPSSPQEFVTLDGNGVILVTAISHDSTELPLKKVYVKAEDENIELKEISYTLSKDSEKSLVTTAFGQYRMDGMYLFPVYLKAKPGEITVDFAKNRNDFEIAEFDASDADQIKDLPTTKPSAKGPSFDILTNFITREFPGFELR